VNLDTGDLVEIQKAQDDFLRQKMVTEIPPELQQEAQDVVDEAEKAGEKPVVSLDGEGPLSQWRLDQLRQQEKEKRRRRRNNKLKRKARRRR
jgi:hypothetical protein